MKPFSEIAPFSAGHSDPDPSSVVPFQPRHQHTTTPVSLIRFFQILSRNYEGFLKSFLVVLPPCFFVSRVDDRGVVGSLHAMSCTLGPVLPPYRASKTLDSMITLTFLDNIDRNCFKLDLCFSGCSGRRHPPSPLVCLDSFRAFFKLL